MSKTIQVRVDDVLKSNADNLFASLGLDTSTAIRMFLTISIENGGIPFEVKLPDNSLLQARNDVLNRKNLSKPYNNAMDAINAMLED
ncbi:MAG: type II toxin-antitoxin system RelB/DinJ family antitoxin [Candidatus Gastranaerophilales bacterium]|nr:type II toxin-antitoxin system RelB/DinJ family antitoxin [Candidatus Gastranaerophilales bacterium]